jgi:hypothetical protein
MRCRVGVHRDLSLVCVFSLSPCGEKSLPHPHRDIHSGRSRRSGRPCPQPDTGRPSARQPLYMSRPSSRIRRPDERIGSSASRIQVGSTGPRGAIVVCVSVMPRSAIMVTRSLRLNLKLVYQLTHRMMICPSKCRLLNSASTGTNGCILSSSPITVCLHQNRKIEQDLCSGAPRTGRIGDWPPIAARRLLQCDHQGSQPVGSEQTAGCRGFSGDIQ